MAKIWYMLMRILKKFYDASRRKTHSIFVREAARSGLKSMNVSNVLFCTDTRIEILTRSNIILQSTTSYYFTYILHTCIQQIVSFLPFIFWIYAHQSEKWKHSLHTSSPYRSMFSWSIWMKSGYMLLEWYFVCSWVRPKYLGARLHRTTALWTQDESSAVACTWMIPSYTWTEKVRFSFM